MFEDVIIIHKVGDEINEIESFFMPDWIAETYAWRFDYKGEKHGKVIAGTMNNPITNEDIIALIEHMVRYMKKLKRGERCRKKI